MKHLQFILFLLIGFSSLADELSSDEKKSIVKSVYDKIYGAMGTAENQPGFNFDVTGEMFMAYMSKDKDGNPQITFEGKAFDVCAKFGDRRDDAIAMLIGHEIGHHRLKHHWGTEFEETYTLEALKMEFGKVDANSAKKFETQADERGGIYCYLAGFNTIGLAEELFNELYTAYNIKPSAKYPTLEERIKIAQERDSIVSTYIKVFETGNYAMLIGEYNVAINCYEYIIGKEFHSREIYNNLGVAYFLQGMSKIDPDEVKYLYPVEIDMQSRLDVMGAKGMGDNIRAIFEKAHKKFEQAIAFDKKYSTGYVNAACALSVLGEYEDASYMARKAVKNAKKYEQPNTLSNARLVQAIINALDEEEGDKEEAEEALKELSESGHLLSKLNLEIFNGSNIGSMEAHAVPMSWMDGSYHEGSKGKRVRERIHGLKYYTIDELTEMDSEDEVIKYTRNDELIVGTLKDSRLYLVEGNDGKFFAFHVTDDDYSDTTKLGLKIGSTQQEVVDAYGMPNSVVSSNQGSLLCYNRSQLVMIIDEKNMLRKWLIWRTIDDL